MTTGSSDTVLMEILDLWSRDENGVNRLLTDLEAVANGGDTRRVPNFQSFTVGTSEATARSTTTVEETLLRVDDFRMINQGMTNLQARLLLLSPGGGRGSAETSNFARQLARQAGGNMQNSIDIYYINKMLAGTATADHINADLAITSPTDELAASVVEALADQDGLGMTAETNWLATPRAGTKLKSTVNYLPGDGASERTVNAAFGLPRIGTLEQRPFFEHRGVPGASLKLSAAITASSITSNVLSMTFAAAEDIESFKVGMPIVTTGLTTNITTAAQIASISGTTVTAPLTASNAADNGTGSMQNGSAMALLIARERCWFSDTGVPENYVVKLEGNAGHEFQMFTYLGYKAYPGAVKVLHLPI